MRTMVGLRFFIHMKYDKQPIDFSRQIQLLKERGMIFHNEGMALETLYSISYFRIANYWYQYECKDNRKFISGCNFDKIISLYSFDRELRGLIFSAIQDIEIAFRTRVGHFLSIKYGAFWFLDAGLFKNKSLHLSCIGKLKEEVSRSHEEFLKEHFEKYDESPFPPSWKVLEVASFGTLSKLYGNLIDNDVKRERSRSFRLPSFRFLENWMQCAAVMRNCCAHHARLWNRRFSTIPKYPKQLPLPWIAVPLRRPEKIYGQLYCLAYLEQSVNPNTNFKRRFIELMKLQDIHINAMGFPDDWKSQPLWQS